METKEVKYKADNKHVVVNGKELNIKVIEYIEVHDSEIKMFIIEVLFIMKYVFYNHIQEFVRRKFDVSINVVNKHIGELEDLGMVKVDEVYSSKFAMLSKKGVVLFTENPKASPAKPPQNNSLRTQTFLSEILIRFAGTKVFDMASPVRYSSFYVTYKERVSLCTGYDNFDDYHRGNYEMYLSLLNQGYPINVEGIKKEITREMISKAEILDERVVRRYLLDVIKGPFSSAKEYIEDQTSLLKDYTKLSEYMKTINTRDELGAMMHKHVYYMNYNKENGVVTFILLKLSKSNNTIIQVMYELDSCIGKMNQLLDKTYLKFNLIIATSNEQRKKQVEKFMGTRQKEIEKETETLIEQCRIGGSEVNTYALSTYKHDYKKAMPYLNTTEVWNLDIERYFEPNRVKGRS